MSVITAANGRHIHYDDVGSGPSLLLITGLGAPRKGMMASLPLALSQRYRIIAMDNRDAGESEPEPEYYTMADLAGDAAALLDALGVDRAHVLGVSLGGMVTLQLALDHPDQVDHLVLMSTFAHGERGHRAGEPIPPPSDWWTDDPVARWETLAPQVVGPTYREMLTDATLEVLAEPERGNRATWEGVMRQEATQAGHDLRDRLDEVRAPTLIIHGELDPAVRAEHADILAAGVPDSRLVMLPGVGHLVLAEEHDRAAAVMLDFLSGSDSDDGAAGRAR
jgi:3-oxoadipate enol-lactonase